MNVVGHVVAQEMDIKLNELIFDIEGSLDPGKFLGRTKEGRAGFQEIQVGIQIISDADQNKLNKWLEVVEERCPVSNNITDSTPVKLTLK